MNVVIIEDESRSAKELSQLLGTVDPDIRVVAILESIEQSVAWLSEFAEPDLIFADIQLSDGLSFEIFEKISISCPIVFCTAFDGYLMNAFETNAISYLLKPVSKEKVAGALEKLKTLKAKFQKESGNVPLQGLLQLLKQSKKSTILVNLKEKIIPVQAKDIAYFYMEHTVVEVCTMDRRKFFMTSSLEELESQLDADMFFRANRQYLVSRHAIDNAERFFSRKLVLKLIVDTPDTILVSKAKASEFLQWLSGNG